MINNTKHIIEIIDDKTRIGHIFDCIEKIEAATKEQTFDGFLDNKILRIAISKWVEIIGEAVVHIKEETKNKYHEIHWQEMIELRNQVLHEYYDINYYNVWDFATIYLKDLKIELEAINIDLNNNFLTN